MVDCMNLVGDLEYRRGQLIIKQAGMEEPVVVPLTQIAVVLVGVRARVTGGIISKLSEYDVSLLVCDWRGIPTAGSVPWREHTRIGIRHRSQAELTLPRKKQAWSRIVSAKISGQSATLTALTGQDTSELLTLSKHVKSGDSENLEAHAARLYWSRISGEIKFSRQPGMKQIGWNSALDYGYTLLRGYGIRAVSGAGLAGALGVFHRGRGNAFALVDDLMEPFRPMIDQIVFSTVPFDKELSSESKRALAAGLLTPFSNDGKSVPTVFNEFAQQYGRYVETEISELRVPRWKGRFCASEGQ